jgi:hypothetical protein
MANQTQQSLQNGDSMIRYFVAQGDQGGSATVTEGTDITCCNPPPYVQIATLYMKTYCTACKREGFIAPNGGPRHGGTAPNGKQWALGGDINVRGCNPPPVFHAPERGMFMRFTSEEIASMSASIIPAHAAQRADMSGPAEYDDYYVLIDQASGKPIANAVYAIKRADGSVEHGTTDS